MTPFDENLEAQLLAAARKPTPTRGRGISTALTAAISLGVAAAVAIIALTSLHSSRSHPAAVPPSSQDGQGRSAALRAEALWTGYLSVERLRVADTAAARAPQSAFPTGTSTAALLAGRFTLANPPPKAPRTVHGYRILPARQAIAALNTHVSDSNPHADVLRVTGLRLTQAPFDTAHGKRRFPAWELHVAGMRAPLYALAISITSIRPASPPQLARTIDNPENELSARVSPDGMTLTLRFIGGPAGDKPCDTSYTAHTLEGRFNEMALVVSFWITQHTVAASQQTACPLVGYPRTATLRLAGPLGHRPLIDSRNYAPVRVIRQPHTQ